MPRDLFTVTKATQTDSNAVVPYQNPSNLIRKSIFNQLLIKLEKEWDSLREADLPKNAIFWVKQGRR